MHMSFQQHVNLLMDWDRGLTLRQLIFAAVEPGMRVLDAGSGSGILALWAAQAGAQVIAVDRTLYPAAAAMAASNRLADRITFRRRDLAELDADDLGGPVDLLLAMVYWNDPRRDAGQSRVVRGLVERCLAPGGAVLPDRVEYDVQVVDWPAQRIESHLRRARRQQRELEERYGLRFEALFEEAMRAPDASWFPARKADKTLSREGVRPLSGTAGFAIDYRQSADYPPEIALEIVADGEATTAIWRQRLCAGQRLIFGNESISWLSPAARVGAGEILKLRLDDTWRRRNVFAIG